MLKDIQTCLQFCPGYDAIMSAHVLMMALLKSEKIQVCLKAWTLICQLPQGLLCTPGWWNSTMWQKKQILSQWGGRGHLPWIFTPSFKINKYLKTIIMKEKQAWTYWLDFLRNLNVKTISWLFICNNTCRWKIIRSDKTSDVCKGNGKIFESLHWYK